MESTALLYLESLLLCFAVLAVLFVANLRYWKPLVLNRLSFIYIFVGIAILAYAGWIILEGHPRFAWANKIATITSNTFVNLACMFYYYYVLKNVGITMKNGKFWYISSFFVITGAFVLNIVSYWTGLAFIVNEQGHYERGPLFFVDLITSYAYLACGVGFAINKAIKADNLTERHRFSTIATAIIPTVLLGVLNDALPYPHGLSTVFYGIIISLLIIYASSSAGRVTRDSLTGLMNRFAFDKQLSQIINRNNHNQNLNVWLLMIDINGFKVINDTFGHAVGDEVLTKMGGTFEKVAKEFDATIARWGGDEFIAYIETGEDRRAQMFMETIKSRVTAECNDDNRFKVTISVGMTKLREYETMKHLFDEADHKLYEDKEKFHRRENKIIR